MKPELYAKELFNKFYMILFDSESDKSEEVLISILAKKCALICVNELINDYKNAVPATSAWDNKKYWKEVKPEIEKL